MLEYIYLVHIQFVFFSLQADPDYFHNWNKKLSLLLALEKYEDALRHVEKYEQTSGFESNFAKGLIFLHVGNYDESVRFFNKQLDTFSNYDTLYNIVIHLFEFGLKNEAKNMILDFYKLSTNYDKGLALQEFDFYEDSIEFFLNTALETILIAIGHILKKQTHYFIWEIMMNHLKFQT